MKNTCVNACFWQIKHMDARLRIQWWARSCWTPKDRPKDRPKGGGPPWQGKRDGKGKGGGDDDDN